MSEQLKFLNKDIEEIHIISVADVSVYKEKPELADTIIIENEKEAEQSVEEAEI